MYDEDKLSENYESPQNLIRKHNVERFESLANKHSCSCAVTGTTESNVTQTICNSEVVADSAMHTVLNKHYNSHEIENSSDSSPNNIIVVSDKLDQSLFIKLPFFKCI